MKTKRAVSLARIIAKLRQYYGEPEPPAVTDPFELILLENVAYLGSDEKREAAFAALKSRVGTRPRDIAAASDKELLSVTKLAGIMPETNVRKLRKCAEIAIWLNGGDLRALMRGPVTEAKRALQKFPGIGGPGAEKILLYSKAARLLALESNGLRVLARIGFGVEQKDYAVMYRSVQDALRMHVPKTSGALINAHLLLRHHGRVLCKRSRPRCELCPVSSWCVYYRKHVA